MLSVPSPIIPWRPERLGIGARLSITPLINPLGRMMLVTAMGQRRQFLRGWHSHQAVHSDREGSGMLAGPWRVIATGILFLNLAVSAQPAGAQLVNPFGRNATSMSAEDLALMREALLMALEARKEGEVTS